MNVKAVKGSLFLMRRNAAGVARVARRVMSTVADEKFVTVATRGSCLSITLTRPKALNSLTLPMVRDLYGAFEKGVADANIKCILLEGAGGKAFCAGGDIRFLREAALGIEGKTLAMGIITAIHDLKADDAPSK